MLYSKLVGSVFFTAVFNAKEDSLKLKLLATGLTPKVVNVVGRLMRSARQKQKEAEAARPGKEKGIHW